MTYCGNSTLGPNTSLFFLQTPVLLKLYNERQYSLRHGTHFLKNLGTNSKFQAPIQITRHQFKILGTNSNHQAPIQNSRHQFKILGTNSKFQAPIQISRHQFKIIGTNSKLQAPICRYVWLLCGYTTAHVWYRHIPAYTKCDAQLIKLLLMMD